MKVESEILFLINSLEIENKDGNILSDIFSLIDKCSKYLLEPRLTYNIFSIKLFGFKNLTISAMKQKLHKHEIISKLYDRIFFIFNNIINFYRSISNQLNVTTNCYGEIQIIYLLGEDLNEQTIEFNGKTIKELLLVLSDQVLKYLDKMPPYVLINIDFNYTITGYKFNTMALNYEQPF